VLFGSTQTGDIYESMAAGVSNASMVVCFMSQKYHESANCMLEAKFARQSGIPIVPVVMQGGGWQASGWLGLLTAGSLWTTLFDDASFESDVRMLHGQIEQMLGQSLPDDDFDEISLDRPTSSEATEELVRLRDDLTATPHRAVEFAMADASEPANIPAGVPKLPARFQPTDKIRELTRLVLSTSDSDMAMSRVGFFGMGGIGKTVTGAAIVRDAAVRQHFHAIVWLPLGQTPVIAKLQNLCHMQCTGKELSSELSSEEKQQALQQAMTGKKVLLCLDDLWEEHHESELNFADVQSGSKVLISTRVKGLLVGAHRVEVGLPSSADSVRMLLSAAEVDEDEDEPMGVREVVDLCGRLPLALGIAGRLAASLGLVGTRDWSGMIGVLKEELRESHSGGAEEGMIRASLRGLKGSAQEQAHVRSVLLLFGLIREDTYAPLEVLLLMFNAVNPPCGDGSRITVMHIRKYLRILINRSLILGTVDRPSVHDLVLDFAVAQHSKEQLWLNHRAIVEAFRASRPADAHGRRKFDIAQNNDPMCSYVSDEIQFHISHGCKMDDIDQDELMTRGLLLDVPQDEIGIAAGRVLGQDCLSQLAMKAEVEDPWAAARYWAIAQSSSQGTALNKGVERTIRAIEAMDKLGAIRDSEIEKHDFMLGLVGAVASMWCGSPSVIAPVPDISLIYL
jgi:hypothetical protein